ncbi:glycerophosphocholine phosphodiesterase GPCPD1-like isoform X2 [Daktulosphaira vitifoliae]|nr:glycerophosphocholine phosphodiesterase GPCPD1-like isoform X2 [Daktulosphaira vitifoliae]XP_050530962.1 glycerophosphocholine phosphodiesterase GPCPD1-like isoform X2 [Daktulosphaira vitifoliae]XP_050530963.1 glycerophosphocholine phosphodiesterase GPCPD1-like isoform X2 [Daktulosphaira vitifoliae]XP_050530964.1 glycerophosphocholine phosphodiesterase GPCPD1-like isoform X2 [Daktulosphaira vitifoliae]XP_050530965.1 glycerophosphocholine phosphodiesterase GPCPD1-like isoform X2 [Daktulosphai
MQQWWDPNSLDEDNFQSSIPEKNKEMSKSNHRHEKFKEKTFTVEADTIDGQILCVSGNCEALGNWNADKAFVLTNTHMTKVKNNRTYYIWTGKIDLPTNQQVLFRYFIAYILEPDGEYITQRSILVHSWESHYEPRSESSYDDANTTYDLYGSKNGNKHVNKGFLTNEYAVQFKLFKEPIKFWKTKFENKKDLMCVKVTPIKLSKRPSKTGKAISNNILIEELSSQEPNNISFGFPFVEVANIPGDYSFQLQSQFGNLLMLNTLHIFQTKVHNFGCMGYLFDIFMKKESLEEPPYHVGFTHVLPNSMINSNGVITAPITSIRHQPIGELKIAYLVIKPSRDITCTLEKNKTLDWKSSYDPLDIGHRGSGSTFTKFVSDTSNIRENTIASLREAGNKGADFVEFDVQLTKDLVPIIYHDFKVSMATRSKTDVLAENVEMVEVPLKQFSFEQLQRLKIYHVKEPYSLSEGHFLNDLRNDYQPFPKLETALTNVDINVGFNIEVKWTMELQDGTYELDNPFDMNLFVDKILKTTFDFAGIRNIVFSCFHPDVCTMLKMKQNKYPVLFLTQGVTKRWPSYEDIRCHTVQTAVYHAACHDLMGVNVHSEDLLRDLSQINMVKETGLSLFCWGEDNNCKDVVNKLKKLGVNAIIYDKLDKSEEKQKSLENPTIFITEDCCDQNIVLMNQELLTEDMNSGDSQNKKNKNEYFMDVAKFGYQNQCASTNSLWNEDCSSNNNLKPNNSPLKTKRLNIVEHGNVITSSSSKKSKS